MIQPFEHDQQRVDDDDAEEDVEESFGGGGNDDGDGDGDGDGGIKDDHKKHHKNDSNETIEEADYSCFDVEGDIRDRGTTCDICILEFEVGDKVAWSPNLDCIHTFHKDCILDWLMRKPTCPNCRLDYLKRKNDEYI
eukprot:CAMPEP_0170928984 /NCGR_PEP_ID=MMETSP0735-20130129/14550_1 /TAXON_ID=186038 /ORGANISM="Fragilariopsis kerguelensis, Strain L26-C5" /LENGTH=136 /DNA_ID=CAMNT_0011330051 /DNA_START=189 /DNA_END=599 /DNA_ORIENTATION=-